MEFPTAEIAAGAVEHWLATRKTATLHYLKQATTEEDGYIEVAFSEIEEHVIGWRGVCQSSSKLDSFEPASLQDVLEHIETFVGSSASDEVRQMACCGIIPTDSVFVSLNGKMWVFFSERRVCIIVHSTDWDGLSEYYGRYMKPTRH